MSGIEAAGLALGLFPLVMKAIAGYAEGCQKIDGKESSSYNHYHL